MRVAVNLTWMAPGRVGGSEAYLTRQLMGLDDHEFEIDLLCDAAVLDHHPVLTERFRTTAMPFSGGHRVIRIGLEHSWLALRARGAAVIHHGGGTVPMVGPGPIVLTIHDLQYRRFPQYFGSVRHRYLDAMVPRSVARAAIVAVPTEFVRGEVVDAFGVDEDRLVVVPHGLPAAVRPSDEMIDVVRRRFGVADRPYVVYPAITHPHKGHRVLIEMLEHLDDSTMLVLIGGAGSVEGELARLIESSPHRDRVVRPGRVAERDRDALIADADALVFPSEFEGFGAPVIEAMSFDTPVVCSSADALVEVVADAGIVVRSPDGEAWAAAVETARVRRAELVELGRARRRDYTDEVSGQAISDAYRRAAG
ncbi:glycosyltransferase family 4 protein [Ilumatobacter sp.]|uniref:glycosyltransferase family 4 protein n=1 Tax=Ilumatobacter sp. TaxID=1967498 RepID=UPI003AF61B64